MARTDGTSVRKKTDPYSPGGTRRTLRTSRCRLLEQQECEPHRTRARARTKGRDLKRLQARVARKADVVTAAPRQPAPEEVLEQLRHSVSLYLGHVLAAEADPDYRVGPERIGLLLGYAKGAHGLVRQLLQDDRPASQMLWREHQHRIRDLLVRSYLKRLADCL